jgi:hypothetical protein
MDVLERNHHALVGGNVDAGDTSHCEVSPVTPAAVVRRRIVLPS